MTVTEPTLPWDAPAEAPLPVRSTDPETSRAGALDLMGRVKQRKREVIAALEVLGVPSPASAIRREMTRQGNIREIGTVRSRLSQLEHDGIARRTGGVSCTPVDEGGTGRPEQLWALTAWDRA